MLIRVNGITLRAECEGEGPPLLLLHGFTGNVQSWDSLVPTLREQYRIVRVDLIGHGESAHPLDPTRYAMEHAAADLVELLDWLAIERTAVLGYSMGGRLALTMAVLYPARVAALIVESGSPGLAANEERNERVRRDQALADRIERDGVAHFVAEWEQLPLFASQWRLSEGTRRTLRESRLLNHPLGLANSLRGMGTGAQPSWWEELARLHMPTLLIVGAEDAKFRGIADEMRARIPQAQVRVIREAGHTVHLEQPERYATEVLDFLQEHQARIYKGDDNHGD